MPHYLRADTASQEVPLGVFVDSTDGNTAETGLTIANTDIKVHKTGATTLANKNSGGATHISGGIYYAVLDATDTDTEGPLTLFVHVAGALSVRLECVVLPPNVYDSLILGSDLLDTNTAQWLGTACATPTVAGVPEVDLTHIAGAAVNTAAAQLGVNVVTNADKTGYALTTTPPTAAEIATAVVEDDLSLRTLGATDLGQYLVELLTDTGTTLPATIGDVPDNAAAAVWGLARLDANALDTMGETMNDLAAAGLGTLPTQVSAALWGENISAGDPGSAAELIYDALSGHTPQTGDSFARIGAAGAGLTAVVLATAPPTAAAIADAVWTEAIADHSGGAGSTAEALAGATAPSAAAVADAVWDELLSEHAGVGSTGAGLSAAGASGDPWATALPGAYGAGTAGELIGNMAPDVDAILVDTAEIGAAGAGLTAVTGRLPAALVSGRIDASVGAMAADAVTAAALAADASSEIATAVWASATRALTDKADFALSSAAIDAVWAKTLTELSAVPGVTAAALDAVNFVFTLARNKIEQTATTATLRKDDGTTAVATSTVSDDGTTAVRGSWT